MTTRRPSHAGSWYSGDGHELSDQLSGWLHAAQASCGAARAIIVPHAGYSYSGPTAAWAYKHINPAGIKRIFLLGPSHNIYSPKCLLSPCDSYTTPIGSLTVDGATCDQLDKSGLFDEMSLAVDEREHSLEMHLPYLVHLFGGTGATLVPIMVGALSEAAEAQVGKLLAPFLADAQNLFVISSDFCHWGDRFNFTYHDPKHGGEIFESVEALDRQGMALIEAQDAAGFAQYQREYGNTICGRHPIAVLLHALNALPRQPTPHQLKFVRYVQSSQVRQPAESSVSYASAVVWL